MVDEDNDNDNDNEDNDMPCLRSLSPMSRDHHTNLSRTLGLVLNIFLTVQTHLAKLFAFMQSSFKNDPSSTNCPVFGDQLNWGTS